MLTRQPPQHPHHEQWVEYARSCVKKGLDYFETQISTNLKNALEVFKACRLFLPQKVREIKPTSLSIDQDLECLPFFDGADKGNLKEELPTYLSKVADLDVVLPCKQCCASQFSFRLASLMLCLRSSVEGEGIA